LDTSQKKVFAVHESYALPLERLLESVMRSSLEYSIIAKDLDKRILTWNTGAFRNYGYKPEEVLGQSAAILHHPDDLESGLFESIHQKALQEEATSGTFQRRRKDGSEFTASVVLTRRDDEKGRPVGFLLMSRDITAEQNLRRDIDDKLRELQRNNEIISRQRDELTELSSPVIKVWDGILVLPVIGVLDSSRAQLVTETLLNAIAETESEFVILDISGVPAIDTEVAQHILRTTEAARLMGATPLISGVRPATAQTIVHMGLNLGSSLTSNSLKTALRTALQQMEQRASDRAREAGTWSASR
jgi:PAS domain S-box-containing protein